MLTDIMADSRAAATMMPTGPTAHQIKERANAAGTQGPPPQAPTRAESASRARDTGERPIWFDRASSTSDLLGSIVETRLRSAPQSDVPAGSGSDVDRPDPAQDRSAERRSVTLAQAAFAETRAMFDAVGDKRAVDLQIVV